MVLDESAHVDDYAPSKALYEVKGSSVSEMIGDIGDLRQSAPVQGPSQWYAMHKCWRKLSQIVDVEFALKTMSSLPNSNKSHPSAVVCSLDLASTVKGRSGERPHRDTMVEYLEKQDKYLNCMMLDCMRGVYRFYT